MVSNKFSSYTFFMLDFFMGVYDQQQYRWQREGEFIQFCGEGIVDLPAAFIKENL